MQTDSHHESYVCSVVLFYASLARKKAAGEESSFCSEPDRYLSEVEISTSTTYTGPHAFSNVSTTSK